MSKYQYIDISSVIQIDGWDDLEDALAGSRVKTTVANPNAATGEQDSLYIFKQPKPRREAQLWSELIASFIAGDLLGWSVQHTQLAIRGGKVGNLLRYIYEDGSESFFAGEQFCKHVDASFDPEQGTRHTWKLIRRIHDEFLCVDKEGKLRPHLSKTYNEFWARLIVFDTFISNTDRHAENWALIGGNEAGWMAPLFDNASSMGCEVDEVSLSKKWFDKHGRIIPSKVQSYAAKGRHHLRDENYRFKFEDLARQFLKEFPDMRTEYEAVANVSLEPVELLIGDIMSMSQVPDVAKMTPRRAVQIMTLLHEGQARVRRCLEEPR